MKVQPTQPTQPTQPSCRVGHICNDALGEVKGAVSVRLGRQIMMNLSQGGQATYRGYTKCLRNQRQHTNL